MEDFPTFGAKAMAGIGRLPDTLSDRSIPIALKRKLPGAGVERFRRRQVEPEGRTLARQCASWANEHLEVLKNPRTDLPESLSDRRQDVVEPLLAISDLAGSDWPQRARSALVEVLTGTAAEDGSIRVRLLADIRGVFEREPGQDRISSRELVASLLDDETSQWQDFPKGKPLTDVALARLLKPFEIAPRTIKLADGKTAKGYLRQSFMDAWVRYVPASVQVPSSASSDPSPASPGSVYAGRRAISQPSPQVRATLAEKTVSLANTGLVTAVTAQRDSAAMFEGEL